jgi:hypothetical protein
MTGFRKKFFDPYLGACYQYFYIKINRFKIIFSLKIDPPYSKVYSYIQYEKLLQVKNNKKKYVHGSFNDELKWMTDILYTCTALLLHHCVHIQYSSRHFKHFFFAFWVQFKNGQPFQYCFGNISKALSEKHFRYWKVFFFM